MAEPFLHAPYAEGRSLFSIGLAPLDLSQWIEVDDRLQAELALKETILASEGENAFAALPESLAGQKETLSLLAAHLCSRFPDVYARDGDAIRILPAGRSLALHAGEPLKTASRLVQEDLLLMRRLARGWRLAAGSLCFPSSWRLSEKIGRELESLHAPVPGFAGRTAAILRRIFDNLKPEQPIERMNWSIYGDGELRHAVSGGDPGERFPADRPIASIAHVRVERQTARKLPASGDILFTVRVHVDPIAMLERHKDGARLARALCDQLSALSAEQLAYKGLDHARGRLIEALCALAGESVNAR